MSMSSTDFPGIVSPVGMAKGGSAHPNLTVVVPVGALARGVAPPTPPLMQELQTVIAKAQQLLAQVRSIPGVDQQAFDVGAGSIVRGLQLIAGSIPARR